MRQIIIAVAIYVVLNLFIPTLWERFMTAAPEWLLRAVMFIFAVGCIAAVFSSDPIYTRIRDARQYPISSTALVALAGAATLAAVWWFLIAPIIRPIKSLTLDVWGETTNADYPKGTRIAGIEWSHRFTELRVYLSNRSDTPYIDLDLVVRPDLPVADIAQATNLPDVVIGNALAVAMRQELHIGATGQRRVNPLVLIATDGGYRVQTKELPRNTTLGLVLAIVRVREGVRPNGPAPGTPDGGIHDREYILTVTGKTPDGAVAERFWYGHGHDANGRIEDVYLSRQSATKIKVEGAYYEGDKKRTISLDVPVTDHVENVIRHGLKPQ